jgi:hypothetical protein
MRLLLNLLVRIPWLPTLRRRGVWRSRILASPHKARRSCCLFHLFYRLRGWRPQGSATRLGLPLLARAWRIRTRISRCGEGLCILFHILRRMRVHCRRRHRNEEPGRGSTTCDPPGLLADNLRLHGISLFLRPDLPL